MGPEQRQSRSSGFSGIPTLGEALPSCRGLDFWGYSYVCGSRVGLPFWYSRLPLTSGLKGWQDSCPGQVSQEAWVSRLWFELRVLGPERETCSSCPHPRALGPHFSSLPPTIP